MRSPLRRVLPLLLSLAAAGDLRAHPGVGIVRAKDGTIFYSDLSRVWRIAPSGEKSVAVPDVHTHELFLDADGSLYGEHLWYEGDRTKKWGHRVWKRSPHGAIADVVPAREGFRSEPSFVRDAAGAMYFSGVERRDTLFRKRPGAPPEAWATGFRKIRWMIAAADGTAHLVDDGDLVRVSPNGRVTRVVLDLARRGPPGSVGSCDLLMGIWLGADGDVFVASYGARAVLRVSPAGEVTTAARTEAPWSPSGGLAAPDGDLWLLENSESNAVRVRRIAKNGAITVY